MSEDSARNRIIVIQVVRIMGVALVLFGLLVIAGRFDLPGEAGYVIALIGLVDTFVAPILLARRWKSPPQ